MAHVITQACCNDASCVLVCPTDAIHPGPQEPGYGATEMLYIDPHRCIDCGACISACPVEAIYPAEDLPEQLLPYVEINALPYRNPEAGELLPAPRAPREAAFAKARRLRVGVVGSGPGGMFAVEALLDNPFGVSVEVTVFERLPTPWGLVRSGVAPDHQATKDVGRLFRRTAARPEVSWCFNVEVGVDLTHHDLLERFDAVLYAVGAASDRALGVPGEGLIGSHSAREFVGWYNGHPDYAHLTFDLSGERAVVIGNGNVALDVSRILLSPVDALGRTDIADYALEALAASKVKEVVVAGRRGPAQMACTLPELLALRHLPDVGVEVDRGLDPDIHPGISGFDPISRYKAALVREYAESASTGVGRKLILKFGASPVGLEGSDVVEAVRFATSWEPAAQGCLVARPTTLAESIPAGLVLRSVGFRGRPVPGLPFDELAGVVPNLRGRVIDPEGAAPQAGAYVSGWIKRGPRGAIGTNRACAEETVMSLFEDLEAGLLQPRGETGDWRDLITSRRLDPFGYDGWKAIDARERRLGRLEARPRVKLTDWSDLLSAAAGPGGEGVR